MSRQYVVRARFVVEGTYTLDAESEEQALELAETRANDMGAPGFSIDSEELDDVEIDEVRE